MTEVVMGSLTLIQTAPGVCYDYQHFITNGHVSIAGKTDSVMFGCCETPELLLGNWGYYCAILSVH